MRRPYFHFTDRIQTRQEGTELSGHADQVLDQDFSGIYTFFIRWTSIPLLTGHYRLSIAVFDKNHLKPHIWHNQLYDLEIVADISDHGLTILDHDWGMITHYEE